PWLATGCDDGSISLWNRKSVWAQPVGEPALILPAVHPHGVLALAFTSDGSRLASIGRDRTIRLWEVGTWREVLTVPSRVGLGRGLAFHPDADRELAIATVEGVRILTAR